MERGSEFVSVIASALAVRAAQGQGGAAVQRSRARILDDSQIGRYAPRFLARNTRFVG
ncbi:hypothetical protein GCM10010990_05620 [Croceicoccus mobilis]|uniref:Uncharacterized protein n=1 Tax=Croceicoccus mobilis TaxID=1703339 RepID=A0A916YSB1_9SPHN|nr:hypothetical protein GCM10010990_05620 [Croceicoccus mobilis]